MTPFQRKDIWMGVFTAAIAQMSVSNREQSSEYMDMEFVVLEAAKTASRAIAVIQSPRRVETAEALEEGLKLHIKD